MDALPPEMVLEVLKALDPLTLIAARFVCRHWRDIILLLKPGTSKYYSFYYYRVGIEERGQEGGVPYACVGCPMWSPSHYTAALAREGMLDLLQWARSKGCTYDSSLSSLAAAYGGSLDVLKWMLRMGHSLSRRVGEAAARGGNVELIQFLWQRNEVGRPLSERFIHAALEEGRLELLKWCVEKGLLRPQELGQVYEPIAYAATSGNVELLKWLTSDAVGLRVDRSSHAMNMATWRGRTSAMLWLAEQGIPTQGISSLAAQSGNLATVRCVVGWCGGKENLRQDTTMAHAAAEEGILDVLLWLREQGCCAVDEKMVCLLALNGHIEELGRHIASTTLAPDYHKLGPPRPGRHCEVLLWLREQGCAWDKTLYKTAQSAKHTENLLLWLKKNGCPQA